MYATPKALKALQVPCVGINQVKHSMIRVWDVHSKACLDSDAFCSVECYVHPLNRKLVAAHVRTYVGGDKVLREFLR